MSFLERTGLEVPESDYSGENSKFLRFWVKPGGNAEIIFLTEAESALSCYQHFCRVKGLITHHTCLSCIGKPCPMCAYAEKHGKNGPVGYKSRGAFFSILDVTPFKTREEKEVVRPQKRLLVAKKNFLGILNTYYENLKKGGHKLRGSRWSVGRSMVKTSPSVGDAYMYLGQVDLSSYEDVDELDYETLLAPDENAMNEILQGLEGATQEPDAVSWEKE